MATLYHYKKMESYKRAAELYTQLNALRQEDNISIIDSAAGARDPFQFISKSLAIKSGHYKNKVPITQDASASAYQIMAYLLLDNKMAKHTNLIKADQCSKSYAPPERKDIYELIQSELVDYLLSVQKKHELLDSHPPLKPHQLQIVVNMLDRKLRKQLFMPLRKNAIYHI